MRSGNNEELWIGSEIFGAVEMEGWTGYFDLVIILGRPAQEIILPCQLCNANDNDADEHVVVIVDDDDDEDDEDDENEDADEQTHWRRHWQSTLDLCP